MDRQRRPVGVDPTIDFDWAEGAPDPAVPKDHFSIRWNGMLLLPAD
jgi:hypothetical protein